MYASSQYSYSFLSSSYPIGLTLVAISVAQGTHKSCVQLEFTLIHPQSSYTSGLLLYGHEIVGYCGRLHFYSWWVGLSDISQKLRFTSSIVYHCTVRCARHNIHR